MTMLLLGVMIGAIPSLGGPDLAQMISFSSQESPRQGQRFNCSYPRQREIKIS